MNANEVIKATQKSLQLLLNWQSTTFCRFTTLFICTVITMTNAEQEVDIYYATSSCFQPQQNPTQDNARILTFTASFLTSVTTYLCGPLCICCASAQCRSRPHVAKPVFSDIDCFINAVTLLRSVSLISIDSPLLLLYEYILQCSPFHFVWNSSHLSGIIIIINVA